MDEMRVNGIVNMVRNKLVMVKFKIKVLVFVWRLVKWYREVRIKEFFIIVVKIIKVMKVDWRIIVEEDWGFNVVFIIDCFKLIFYIFFCCYFLLKRLRLWLFVWDK